jgi:hypothetical protein
MDATNATNVAEAALKSISGNMPQIYVHLRGESSKILLQKKEEGDNVFRLLHPKRGLNSNSH